MLGSEQSMNSFKSALKLFNEKAEKLNRLSFTQIMLTEQTGFSLNVEKVDEESYKGRASVTGPMDESVDALLLTIRFFMVSNEPSSFARLDDLYEKSDIDPQLKAEFYRVRAELNDFLDSKGTIHIKFNNDELTYRLILDTMIYGGTAHANHPATVARYRMWMQSPFFVPLIKNEFNYALAKFIGFVGCAWKINRRALTHLEKASS